MTLKHKYNIRALCMGVVMMTLTAFLTTACGDDKNDGGAAGGDSVEWDMAKTIKPDSDGAAVLTLSATAGTPWTAEIISGENWVSFVNVGRGVTELKGEVGTSLSSRILYVYYTANDTRNDRTATIRFTYQGRQPEELEMVQYSTKSGQDVYTAGWDRAWPEIPAQKVNGDLVYVTHFGPVMNEDTNREFNGRNFTLCFDKTKHASWWVAYPMHSAYLGGMDRPNPDPWAYDPKIESKFQPDLGAGGYTNGTTYNRGHQIANADRTANRTLQYQTFYCTNATPQYARLNSPPWAKLEKLVRDWRCPDTLYVVTGAYWKPGSTASTTDRNGMVCPLPDNYFKVLVRTIKGNTGKRLENCTAGELQAIGFWTVNSNSPGEPRSWVKSIKEIEDLTGFEFFPVVPDEVKTQKSPGVWGGL